jgi:hypothetical protein
MRLMFSGVITALLLFPLAAMPTNGAAAPSTSLATRTAEMEPLLDGSLRFAPPPGWELTGRSDDNTKASYAAPDGAGRISIHVQPQDRMFLDPEKAAAQMAMVIGKTIREDADRANKQMLLPPRVQKDDRFFLKMHDRTAGDTGTTDRLQLYRVIGLNLVHVAVNALTDSPEKAKEVHALAEDLLVGMQLTRGAKHVVFPRNQLKIRTPVDWKETKTDAPNGLVVTYADPKKPERQLIVRARVLPKDARVPGAKRELMVDKMIDDERRQPPMKDVKTLGAEEIAPADDKYLRRVSVPVQAVSLKLRVETRYFVVGDVLVSLRIVGGEEDKPLAKIADQLVAETTPIR